jgi:phosphatidylinositol alpha-mannosyltransferase
MKIGLVCPLSFTTLGGVQNHTLILGKELQRQGLEVVYFSPTADSKKVPQPHVQIGGAINLPNLNGSWSDVAASFSSHDELFQLLKKQQIDVLHVQSPIVPFINWQLIKASPVPVVVTLHSGWEKDAPVEQLLFMVDGIAKQLKPLIAQTIAVSRTAADCERYFSDAQTKIIPNPIDLTTYAKKQLRPADLETERVNFLFLGRFDRRKGLSELLKSLPLLPPQAKAKFRLHVIGGGPLELEIQLLAESLGITEQVVWHGRLNEKKKLAYLQHADVMVAPSLSGESFGIVLIEAMAAGLPIICGNNRGYQETLEQYPALDCVVDPHDAVALAKAITHLLADDQLRKKLSQWGKHEVKKYAVQKVAQQHIEIYQTLIRGLDKN